MTLIPELLPPGDRLQGGDLAEQALEGLVRSPHYGRLEATHAVLPVADIVSEDGRRASQIVHGEIFDILFRRAGRAYGRSRRDGAVGWVSEEALEKGAPYPNYRVASLGATLPFNALVSGKEDLSEVTALKPVSEFENDPVAVAQNFIGMRVEAGARSNVVDGIGLAQQVLFACGRAAPRRAVELAATGRNIEVADLQSGDILVWVSQEDPAAGHAAVVMDEDHVIHACAKSGTVVAASLKEVEQACREAGMGEMTARRLSY